MSWGVRRRKMGYEGGRARAFAASRITRGGVDFELDSVAGTVTCTVCKLYATSTGFAMPLFMAWHQARHFGTPAQLAQVEKVHLVVEELLQLGAAEFDQVGALVGQLVARR